MQKNDLKTKLIIIATIIVVIITIGLYIYKHAKDDTFEEYENHTFEHETSKYENSIEEFENITIHITGEVKYPGVVVLKNGARIVDAIEAAGGETEEADLNKLNLAYILNDGEKIYVPNKNDMNSEEILENQQGDDKQSSININTATVEELTELPGIGEATANKIIEYRKQNGKFETIEELKNVAGIGNSKFENIKDKIKVK